MKKIILLLTSLLISNISYAHFQMIYTEKMAVEATDNSKIDISLMFVHPFDGKHSMNMGKDINLSSKAPLEFGYLHNGKKVNLLKKLKAFKFQSKSNSSLAYKTKVRLKRAGDYVFYVNPSPYYEKSEDAYIQQFTKVIVNRMGVSTDWQKMVMQPAEIMPLDRPYGLWENNVFRGIVKKNINGKMVPAPNATIEIEYLNYKIKKGKFVKGPILKNVSDVLATQIITTNKDGEFSYALPKSGWWGFAALGVGQKTKYKGKDLSQDAVIWVYASEID